MNENWDKFLIVFKCYGNCNYKLFFFGIVNEEKNNRVR